MAKTAFRLPEKSAHYTVPENSGKRMKNHRYPFHCKHGFAANLTNINRFTYPYPPTALQSHAFENQLGESR